MKRPAKHKSKPANAPWPPYAAMPAPTYLPGPKQLIASSVSTVIEMHRDMVPTAHATPAATERWGELNRIPRPDFFYYDFRAVNVSGDMKNNQGLFK